LRNVIVERSAYAVVEQEYRQNHMEFTLPSPDRFDALCSVAGGVVPDRPTKNRVLENVVFSAVRQPPGSRAIVAEDTDYNVDCATEITGNDTAGFPIDIMFIASADNAITKTATIKDNIIQHMISREQHSASVGRTTVLLTGNHLKIGNLMLNYPDNIPTQGLWNEGQRVVFDKPDPNGAIGAICTETGVPGQWRKYSREP
jgi:hypothetical protein